MKKPRWALFISGQGSNMAALLDQKWDVDLALVVSSNPQAPGLYRARRAGLPTLILQNPIDWSSVYHQLEERQITHLFLLGFLKIVPQSFLKSWKKTILNLHPSLLPNYPGLRSVERAHQDGESLGVTVHHVVAAVDAGAHVLQKTAVPQNQIRQIALEKAMQRVHQVEYELVRKAVGRVYG